MRLETYYLCNPEKNTECKKRGCAFAKGRGKKPGPCSATDKPEFAVLNEEGRPVKAFVVMRGDRNGTD